MSAPERSKSKEDSVLDKATIDELGVDPKERGIRLGCPTVEGEMDLGSSTAQYFGYRPNGSPILRFEHTKKRFRRGDIGLIKEWIAVEKDPLEALGIDNLERQIMVGDPVEEECSKALAAKPSTQPADKKLVVRIIEVDIDEVGDGLVRQG